AIADADGVEPHAYKSRGLDTLFDFGGQVIEVHVAGIPLVPDAGDADLRLVHVLACEAGAIEHGLTGTLALGLRDSRTVLVERHGPSTLEKLGEKCKPPDIVQPRRVCKRRQLPA